MTDLRPQVAYELRDRYARESGRVFLSGTQALARFAFDQLRADRARGLDTAAFVCGYPGSPLGGFDKEAAAVARQADGFRYVAQPGLNEELAATAVMGSQLASTLASARHDGVIGVWYGKAPGLDRSNDAIRHAVFAGTSRYGGAVALVGDDPGAKSSTLPSTSDATLVDLHVPIVYPGDVQEALDLGRHAIALSRASGLWVGMKIVAGVADSTGTVDVDPMRIQPVMPVVEVDGAPFVPHPSGLLLTPRTLEMEREFIEVRLEVARRYGIENNLNRITVDPPDAWLGVIACGHTYHELREAFRLLGLATDDDLRAAGIRVAALSLPLPLDQQIVRDLARGVRELFVVEEKNPTLERMVKEALYGTPDQPVVIGKTDAEGRRAIPQTGAVDADVIIGPLRERLVTRLADRIAPLPERPREKVLIPVAASRAPYFCSGCPHNWGAKVPDHALVGGGIGCHAMVALMEPERVGDVIGFTAMGGEGAQWVGAAPFVDAPHMFQNIGDGTYFHSGQLAVQFAISTGARITYKLLWNGAVAMTGGQHAQGAIGLPELLQILLLQGVKRIIVTTDDVAKYRGVQLPDGVDVWDRERIVEAQEALAAVDGVTVLVHDQECATEKRRARARSTTPSVEPRVVINERVCEGCGDCGDVSDCLSVQPVETEFGRKTRIHQTSCNLDYSCVKGDCPSFMMVTPGAPARAPSRVRHAPPDDLPEPPVLMQDEVVIRMPGIGGTGVVTISQIVGTAALLDGASVRGLDQTGLAQKAGPVVSDLHITRDDPARSGHAAAGSVDVMLALDMLAATTAGNLAACSPDRTTVVGSTTKVPTGAMVVHPDLPYPVEADLRAKLDAVSRAERNIYVDAGGITEALFGSSLPANVFVLGVAAQAGLLPVRAASIERAIELNGVAVASNIAAFNWGRSWVADPRHVAAAVAAADVRDSAARAPRAPKALAKRVDELSARSGLGDMLTLRADDLARYHDVGWADRWLTVVERVARAEAENGDPEHPWQLTDAVARNLHKLMAYKDEYEVARLLLLPEARQAAQAVGGPKASITFLLHPPVLRALGMKRKIKLGRWARPMLRVLASMRRVRGTALDPFRFAKVRRVERAMIPEYIAAIDRLLARLSPDSAAEVTRIAGLPDQVRGYEDLKLRRAATYRAQLADGVAAVERQFAVAGPGELRGRRPPDEE